MCVDGVGCRAVHSLETWQDHLALAMQICLGAHVQALHQELLVQQWVVGPQGAGCIVVQLVVVAKLRLPDRWDIFVHVYFSAHGHHDEDSNETRRWWVWLNLLLGILLDNVPKLPYKFRMKYVKWLSWVSLTVLNVGSE